MANGVASDLHKTSLRGCLYLLRIFYPTKFLEFIYLRFILIYIKEIGVDQSSNASSLLLYLL